MSVSQIAQVEFNQDPAPQSMNQCILINEINQFAYVPSVGAIECLEFNNGNPTNIVIETAPDLFNAEAGKSIHLQPNVHLKANAHLKIDYDPEFQLAWYAPNSVGVASHHEKLEIGLRLSADLQAEIANFFDNDPSNGDGINPYNRHDLDIQMTLFNNGNPIDKVDAFYYIPQVIANGDFADDTTSYNFRLRHAPRELGEYTAVIELLVAGAILLKKVDIKFTVVPSSNKGYLEQGIHGRHMRYAKTKESFFGVGQVIPWGRYPDWYNWNTPATLDILTEEMTIPFEKLNDAGGNFSRVVSATWSLDFEAEVLGNYSPKRGQAWYFDRLTDFCNEEEVYFIYCMKVHAPFEVHYDANGNLFNNNQSGWGFNPYNDNSLTNYPYASEPPIGITEVNQFYSNPAAMGHYQNYIRYVVSRWGYASSIAGWQVMSEIDNTSDYRTNSSTQDIVRDWVHEMLKFIALDQLDRHLRSVSTNGSPDAAFSDLDNINIHESPFLNFGGTHQYTDQDLIEEPISGYGNFRNRNVIHTYEAVRNLFTGSNGDKELEEDEVDGNYTNNLFIFDEHGVRANRYDDTPGVDNSNVGDAAQGLNKAQPFHFHNDLWASICSGAAVAGLDWWLAEDPDRQNLWYAEFPHIQTFFSTIDFEIVDYCEVKYNKKAGGLYIANRWPWKRDDILGTNYETDQDYDEDDLLEAITMVSKDKTQGFGWCHNRSHYWWNLKDDANYGIKNMVYPETDLNDDWHSKHLFRPIDDDLVESIIPIGEEDAFFRIQDVKPVVTYVIRFYDTRTGQWIHQQEKVSSGDGTLKVKSPDMTNYPDLAYTIRQKGTTWNSPQAPIQEADSNLVRTVGSRVIEKSSIFVIYPNPNEGNFVVNSTSDPIQEISISDNTGKEIARISVINQLEYTCNLDLAEGAYTVTVRTKGKIEVIQVIVVK